jgi:two-component SAPR family response regulator
MIVASQMIYVADKQAFYAATIDKRLIKISLKEPKWEPVTEKLDIPFKFGVLYYSLFTERNGDKMYMVVDKQTEGKHHEINIFSISLPIPDDGLTESEDSDYGSMVLWMIIAIFLAASAAYVVYRKRKAKKEPAFNSIIDKDKRPETPEDGDHLPTDDNTDTDMSVIKETKYYDIDKSAIYLLGNFMVLDKNGKNITAKFSKRMRDLFILLILSSINNENGIDTNALDEMLWQDMNEDAARNNRNVYVRKLRVIIEEIGDMSINSDKINYGISFGKEVFLDYNEACELLNDITSDGTNENLNRLLELLERGALLPNMSFEWLDKFKGDFSNKLLSSLNVCMKESLNNGNDKLAMRIAKIVMMHDPFSEESLSVQCYILCNNHTTGLAKALYDNFCKNYELSLDEKFAISFNDICKRR